MKASLKILAPLFFLLISFSSCKDDEPAGPKCAFDPSGITVGYYRVYGVGGGIETCEYSLAESWQGFDYDFRDKGEGYLFRFRTSVNPVAPACGELWLKVHATADFTTGKRYEAIGWVQQHGTCNSSNITGWIEFSKFDKEAQSVSGRFALGDATSRANRLDEIKNGKFENAPLSILN